MVIGHHREVSATGEADAPRGEPGQQTEQAGWHPGPIVQECRIVLVDICHDRTTAQASCQQRDGDGVRVQEQQDPTARTPRKVHGAQGTGRHRPPWPHPHGHPGRARRRVAETHHVNRQPRLQQRAHLAVQPGVSDVVTAGDDADIRDGPPKDQTSSMVSAVSPTFRNLV